ncbi:MAG: hypothetical protein KDE04_27025, partial [Anaerolineales bacterium]|nr:hypothetical protein [Anaerolineales bacterium]
AEDDPEKYKQFWGEYGRYFKEGTAIDPTAKDDVLPFFRYHTSKSAGELTSLDAYLERKPDTQTEIYYVTGDSVSSVANSPHLDPFKERDLEVLYWVDPLDVLIAPGLMEYKETPFKNIDDADIELPESEDEAEEETSEATLPEKEFNQFVGRCVTTLGDKVIEVRASKVLKNSPVRLVAPADAQNNGMD